MDVTQMFFFNFGFKLSNLILAWAVINFLKGRVVGTAHKAYTSYTT